jgi:iron complex transport system substrate-binding protein
MNDLVQASRRGLVRGLIAALLCVAMVPSAPQSASARDIVDATGRAVAVPDAPARVFAAGPPASVLLYALKPEAMIGC